MASTETQFKTGQESHKYRGGRPNRLADAEFAKSVAEAFVAGMTRPEMCELFEVKDPDTITRWRRDPRVKAIAFKLLEDRILQVTRRVDAVISERLLHAEDLSVKDLLEIRKEFLGGKLRAQTERADDETISEAADFLEQNPDAAEQLDELLRTGKIPGVERE